MCYGLDLRRRKIYKMARLNRVSPIGIPQHIIQRGNNRQVCFGCEEDMKVYLNWLKKFSKKYFVNIHAWVLMTNHVHILCMPHEKRVITPGQSGLNSTNNFE